MKANALSFDLVLSLPPFHAVAVDDMPARRQPSGELIDPLLRTAFDPGIDGIVHISDLHLLFAILVPIVKQ
jgi:hypothetical protein